jgi:hypothetical protein
MAPPMEIICRLLYFPIDAGPMASQAWDVRQVSADWGASIQWKEGRLRMKTLLISTALLVLFMSVVPPYMKLRLLAEVY